MLSSLPPFERYMNDLLAQKQADGSYRSLRTVHQMADFCSNDYIGLARNAQLRVCIGDEYNKLEYNGATGSRLLSGNTAYTEMVEQEIADFHGAEAALLYGSGYAANMGLIAAIARSTDLLLYDEWVHASMHDGMRLSRATAIPFRHNDMAHLEDLLRGHTTARFVFILTESVFSMDGDLAPIGDMQRLAEVYNAHLIVDEAHATGVYGRAGRGLVDAWGGGSVFARVHTFGQGTRGTWCGSCGVGSFAAVFN
jgi:8-amino-7-oxononanoate synthase